MSISYKEINRVAELARLEISEEQISEVQGKLSQIISFVNQLKSAQTAGLEPLLNPHDEYLELRPDVISEPDKSAQFQSIAPESDNNLYVVPKVID